MSFRPFNHTVNVLAFEKEGKTYAGTYAWFTQVGYDEVMGLLGEQSVTAAEVKVGDIVGISACSKEQFKLASFIGETHSNEVDKLAGVDCVKDGSAILLNGARNNMVCKVLAIYHLEGIEADNLVYFKILKKSEDPSKEYLLMSDFD